MTRDRAPLRAKFEEILAKPENTAASRAMVQRCIDLLDAAPAGLPDEDLRLFLEHEIERDTEPLPN